MCCLFPVNGAAADTKLIHGNFSNQENGDITSGTFTYSYR